MNYIPARSVITLEELETIMALMHRPRTANEVAERTGTTAVSAGHRLAALERMGKVVRKEKIHQLQIWEKAP